MAGDLAKTQTGEPVQTQEKTIVHDLDVLIAELEKQCDNCKGGIKKNKPNTRHEGLDDPEGTGGVGDLVDPGAEQQGLGEALGPRAGPHPAIDVGRVPARVSHGPRAVLSPPRRREVRPGQRHRRPAQGDFWSEALMIG